MTHSYWQVAPCCLTATRREIQLAYLHTPTKKMVLLAELLTLGYICSRHRKTRALG